MSRRAGIRCWPWPPLRRGSHRRSPQAKNRALTRSSAGFSEPNGRPRQFTIAEARGKIGRQVRRRTTGRLELDDIRAGTTGQVVEAHPVGDGCAEVVVRWNLPQVRVFGRLRPLCDWFTRTDYERLVEEMP